MMYDAYMVGLLLGLAAGLPIGILWGWLFR